VSRGISPQSGTVIGETYRYSLVLTFLLSWFENSALLNHFRNLLVREARLLPAANGAISPPAANNFWQTGKRVLECARKAGTGALSARGSEKHDLLAAHVPAKGPSLTGLDCVRNKRLVFVDERGEALRLPGYRVLGVTGRSCSSSRNSLLSERLGCGWDPACNLYAGSALE